MLYYHTEETKQAELAFKVICQKQHSTVKWVCIRNNLTGRSSVVSIAAVCHPGLHHAVYCQLGKPDILARLPPRNLATPIVLHTVVPNMKKSNACTTKARTFCPASFVLHTVLHGRENSKTCRTKTAKLSPSSLHLHTTAV